MMSLWVPCRTFGCFSCHHFYIKHRCRFKCDFSPMGMPYCSLYRCSWIAVCQEMAVNYQFVQHDQQTEQQSLRVSLGGQVRVGWEHQRASFPHTSAGEKEVQLPISESPKCTCAFLKCISKVMKIKMENKNCWVWHRSYIFKASVHPRLIYL